MKKSDTMHITRAFLDGMKEAAAQEVHIVDIIDKHIEYCTGCFNWKRNGGGCIHNDDMKELLDEVLESDLLLFSYPLYSYGMPAPMKAFADRTMPQVWRWRSRATGMFTSGRRIFRTLDTWWSAAADSRTVSRILSQRSCSSSWCFRITTISLP